MRIVSWNCSGALRKKLPQLLSLNADIYIVQECEKPEGAIDSAYKSWAKGSLWVGSNKHRGLGVFSSNAPLVMLDWDGNGLESFVPFTIDNKITALAVWTRHANSPTFRYIGQLWKYLQVHKARIGDRNMVICGDLNSNARWDVWDRWWNHSDVVRELSSIGIESVYHHQTGEQQGKESQPTFFMHRKLARPYHIDYAFASADLLRSSKISVGRADEWLAFSDHVPIVFDFACDLCTVQTDK
ncbi:MAG: endonuclease/exonuclease/phosphatase family protein [Nitrospira sp.]|nr:endonuclease/exonuclease/phosphatase family protein [Nitrospira sp.]